MQFNPIQNHVLVTGGSNGQIFIWDTKTFSEPFAPGQAMTPMDEITSVSWNNSVSHILASTGNGGYTSIWDLKTKERFCIYPTLVLEVELTFHTFPAPFPVHKIDYCK